MFFMELQGKKEETQLLWTLILNGGEEEDAVIASLRPGGGEAGSPCCIFVRAASVPWKQGLLERLVVAIR